MKARRFAFLGNRIFVFQLRAQAQHFFVFGLRRAVLLHTERAGVDPEGEQGNDNGEKADDIPKHFFLPCVSACADCCGL